MDDWITIKSNGSNIYDIKIICNDVELTNVKKFTITADVDGDGFIHADMHMLLGKIEIERLPLSLLNIIKAKEEDND